MRFISIFLSIISTLCIPVESIINGSFIGVTEAPFYVGLVRDDGFNVCGGSIISKYWIVTAGHCIDGFAAYGASSIAVLSGASAIKSDGTVHEIEKCIVHGNFEYLPNSADSDIALIKLKEPISFNEDEQPIKISPDPPKVGEKVRLIGKGTQGRARGSTSVLKMSESTVISREACQEKMFPDLVTNNVFCAGSTTGNTYFGDSGSPIVTDGKLVGIVSWGESDIKQAPSAYTRVHLFYDWILKQTGLKY